MTPEETLQSRLRIATATAAAAVTVAIGITVASLSGYSAGPTPPAEADTASAVGAVVTPPPQVVLVPVKPTASQASPASSPEELAVVLSQPVEDWTAADARDERGEDQRWERDDDEGRDDDERGEHDGDDDEHHRGRGHEGHDDDD